MLTLIVWNFLDSNKITLQSSAFNQQKLTANNSVKQFKIFERNKVVHAIVNCGNVSLFKEFIKYSKDDILEVYNENSQLLLHISVINNNYEMIKLFLDGCELRKCFKLNDLPICRFYSFINHKSNDGETPFEWLLNNSSNAGD